MVPFTVPTRPPRIFWCVRWIAFSPEVGAYLNLALFVLRTLAREGVHSLYFDVSGFLC